MLAIIDYGMGNLHSVKKALALACESIGLDTKIIVTRSANTIKKADAVILPGVGAFGEAMLNLRKYKLVDSIKDFVETGKPFLGVCLGYQLLFKTSTEHGKTKGLGILSGEVKKFDLPAKYKIPHMGWNTVKINDCPIFRGIKTDSYFYFVHSYYVIPKDKNIKILSTDYGIKFASGVFKDNIFGLQFHPEKSQKCGIKVLENFCKMSLKKIKN